MVKLIKHTAECDRPDDPSLPFRLELIMRAPEFMAIAYIGLYGGTEDVIARGESLEEIKAWMLEHGLTDHPRLSRWKITENDKVIESHNWN